MRWAWGVRPGRSMRMPRVEGLGPRAGGGEGEGKGQLSSDNEEERRQALVTCHLLLVTCYDASDGQMCPSYGEWSRRR